MRILVVEDEHKLAAVIRRGLEEHGYAVDVAYDGDDALSMAEMEPYDLIVLDVMLPGIDGITVCRRLRSGRRNIPVLMLTARDTVDDRVAGLDAGADDYLVKPFAFRELLARVRALLRRDGLSKDPVLRVGNLEVDTVTHEVRRDGRPVELHQQGVRHAGVLHAQSQPSADAHADRRARLGLRFMSMSNVIDVYVRYLRRKLGDDEEPRLLRTVRGTGYQLRAPPP